MNPINFEVTRSKVKVTVAFNAKTVSAQFLEKVYELQSLYLVGRLVMVNR